MVRGSLRLWQRPWGAFTIRQVFQEAHVTLEALALGWADGFHVACDLVGLGIRIWAGADGFKKPQLITAPACFQHDVLSCRVPMPRDETSKGIHPTQYMTRGFW